MVAYLHLLPETSCRARSVAPPSTQTVLRSTQPAVIYILNGKPSHNTINEGILSREILLLPASWPASPSVSQSLSQPVLYVWCGVQTSFSLAAECPQGTASTALDSTWFTPPLLPFFPRPLDPLSKQTHTYAHTHTHTTTPTLSSLACLYLH